MNRFISLTIEFFTNIQIFAIVQNETFLAAMKEIKVVVMVIVVRLLFAFVEKYGKLYFERIKNRRLTK